MIGNVSTAKENFGDTTWYIFVLSAATFPYYKRSFLPSEDQKILRNIWIKLKNLGLDNKVLTNPNNELKIYFKKNIGK